MPLRVVPVATTSNSTSLLLHGTGFFLYIYFEVRVSLNETSKPYRAKWVRLGCTFAGADGRLPSDVHDAGRRPSAICLKKSCRLHLQTLQDFSEGKGYNFFRRKSRNQLMNLGSLRIPLEVTKELHSPHLISPIFVKYTVENKHKIPA